MIVSARALSRPWWRCATAPASTPSSSCPGLVGSRWPVILHRTPYSITAADASDKTDCTRAWLPSREEPLRGSILQGWHNIVAHGYAAVYQDTRGRHGSEGEDRVYADDASDGHDTLDWIAGQPWSNGMVGMSGSPAGATTTFAAASTRHPTLRVFRSGGCLEHLRRCRL